MWCSERSERLRTPRWTHRTAQNGSEDRTGRSGPPRTAQTTTPDAPDRSELHNRGRSRATTPHPRPISRHDTTSAANLTPPDVCNREKYADRKPGRTFFRSRASSASNAKSTQTGSQAARFSDHAYHPRPIRKTVRPHLSFNLLRFCFSLINHLLSFLRVDELVRLKQLRKCLANNHFSLTRDDAQHATRNATTIRLPLLVCGYAPHPHPNTHTDSGAVDSSGALRDSQDSCQ